MVMVFAVADKDQGSLRPVRPGLLAFRMVVVVFNGIIGSCAFANLPLAQCYAIFLTMPILIALLAIPMLGEKIDFVRGVAVLLGLGGVAIVGVIVMLALKFLGFLPERLDDATLLAVSVPTAGANV